MCLYLVGNGFWEKLGHEWMVGYSEANAVVGETSR
jgi:hypothetical protein